MAENTKIEWADHTFNPWMGCTKVSVGPQGGCEHCYAEVSTPSRTMRVGWGTGQPRVRTSPSNWKLPERWNAKAQRLGVRYRVFCASLADVFDNEVPAEWRAELFRLIEATPHLDWLLLTKRIGNAKDMMFLARGGHLPLLPNVWLGATICNQAEADRDIPKLLTTPAAKRFLSIEPLLGPLNVADIKDPHGGICLKPLAGIRWVSLGGEQTGCKPQSIDRIDWVIVGGESGPQARPMHPEWARSLRDQCEVAGVPFLFKQWGEWTPGENVERQRGIVDTAFLFDDGWHIYPLNLTTDHGHIDDQPDLYRVGKKAAGRLLDGRTWDGAPA